MPDPHAPASNAPRPMPSQVRASDRMALRMATRRRLVAVGAALLLVVVGRGADAQTLQQTDLVLGQVARIEVVGAAPGDLAAFLVGFSGLGAGPCFPSAGLCLDLLAPTLLAVLPADAQGEARIQTLVPASTPLVPIFTQAAVIPAGGAVVKTNAIAAAILPLSSLGDDFSGPALEPAWSVLNAGILHATVSAGELHLRPLVGGPSVTWYQGDQGPLVYKLVTGDFTVTATVRAFDPLNPSAPPPAPYRLGGLMARDPASTAADQEFVHVAVGGGDAGTPVAVEDKTTTQSVSDFVLYPLAVAAGELRITRQGALMSLFHRPIGGSAWQLLRAHAHPGLPATLQVGLMVYSNPVDPRIEVAVDRIDFAAP